MPRWALTRRAAQAALSRILFAVLIGLMLPAARATAANYDVTSTTDDGTGGTNGTLSWAINQSNTAGGTNTITIGGSVGTINMSGSLPMIASDVTFVGNSTTVQGNNNRLFFVNSGTVAFQNLAISGGKAQGGHGGDGDTWGTGGGGGGGLFVNAGANVTIQDVSFSANSAVGGNGGSSTLSNFGYGGGGGGGFGGDGGIGPLTGGGGGGGGGVSGNGGDGSFQTGGTGSGGTPGGGPNQPGGDGTSGAPGGGGAGGDFGGGGGAGIARTGGAGGFGGGGGAYIGGPGGAGGFGAGNGGDANLGADGGSAYGGAVFVRDGGSLTVIDSSAAADNSVTVGNGGTGNAVNGNAGLQARGTNLYLMPSVNAVFSGTGTSTFSGTISGDGGVIKEGTGTLILSGANTYGHTQVNEGLLTVNGSILGDATVGANGTLGGTGSINGGIENSGAVAPGNSIGTLSATGAYTSQNTATTQIEINDGGNTPGTNNDLLAVNSAQLNGGTVSVSAASGTYTAGTQYTFLTTTSGFSGSFDSITDDLAGFHMELLYLGNDILFQLVNDSTNYAAEAQTLNQFGVATYIDANSANPDLQGLVTQLDSLSPDQLRQALQQLTPESVGTIAQLGVQNSTILCLQLSRQLRPGGSSVGSSEDEGSGDGDTAAARPMSREAAAFVASFGGDGGPVIVRGQDGGDGDWTAWATGYGMGGTAQSDGNAAGGDYGLGGVLIAVQRNLDDEHVLGLYGAYTGFSLSTDGPQQSQSANGGEMGGFYRGGDGFNYYILSAGIGPDSYRSSRTVSVGNIVDVAEGSYGGWQSSIWLERGVSFRQADWDIQPLAALNYVFLRQNGYTEQSASIANLQVDAVDTNALRGVLGGYLSRKLVLGSGRVLTPEFRAFWIHEFLEPETTIDSSFSAIGGPSFAANGLNFGRDWALIGLGGKWDLNSQLSLFANYDLQVNARQTANYGSGGLQYSW